MRNEIKFAFFCIQLVYQFTLDMKYRKTIFNSKTFSSHFEHEAYNTQKIDGDDWEWKK